MIEKVWEVYGEVKREHTCFAAEIYHAELISQMARTRDNKDS